MFYTGRTKDGSDARQVGMYVSPCGNYWSSEPYTEEQRESKKREDYEQRMHNNIHEHLKGCKSFMEEYYLVKDKKSTLPRSLRLYLVNWIENICQ